MFSDCWLLTDRHFSISSIVWDLAFVRFACSLRCCCCCCRCLPPLPPSHSQPRMSCFVWLLSFDVLPSLTKLINQSIEMALNATITYIDFFCFFCFFRSIDRDCCWLMRRWGRMNERKWILPTTTTTTTTTITRHTMSNGQAGWEVRREDIDTFNSIGFDGSRIELPLSRVWTRCSGWRTCWWW